MKRLFLLTVVFTFAILSFVYAAEKITPVTNIDFKPQTGEISYELKVPALIRVRVGVLDGPLYATLTNWEQKQSGKYLERWDGMDTDKKAHLGGGGDIVATFNYISQDDNVFDPKDLIAGFPMVDNSIGRKLPSFSINRIHKNHKRENCRDVALDVDFLKKLPKTKDGFYIVSKKIPIKMSFKPGDQKMFRNEHYAVHIFVDDIFTDGEIDGYAPYTWTFDPSRLNKGKHVIIINCAGYDDHYGVGVLPVYVKK